MKKIIREYLDIPATERRGILALVFAILLVQTFRLVYPMMLSDSYPLDKAEAIRFTEWVIRHDTSLMISIMSPSESIKQVKINGFPFDPNTLTQEGWIKLGFSNREAESALKFIRKGGKFKIRTDLQKLYFIDSVEYKTLEPWIALPESYSRKPWENHPRTEEKQQVRPVILELNSADTLALQHLKGIGPYWARRIVRQRERLGGFYRMEQLIEMKGFNDTLFQKIIPQIWLDTSLIQKINVNSSSDSLLQKHPYCWYGVGKSIVIYRTKHGPFKDAGDLRKIIAIRPEQLDRLLPYLLFE